MAAIKIYGTTWCQDCKRSKKFLAEQRIPYDWIDIEEDAGSMALVERLNDGKQIVPTIVFEDGSALAEPSNAELAEKLGLQTAARQQVYDLVIIGGGPAGLTAALYTAREDIRTLVVERAGFGGQAGVTERLDNFPGFPGGIGGGEFADRLREQAASFGAELITGDVVAMQPHEQCCAITLADGRQVAAHAFLLATGSTYRRLNVPGEDDFIGAGVHFCATCDGAFYRGKEIAVVGGGNSAGEESLFLLKFASRITMLTDMAGLTASAVVRQKVSEQPNISIVPRSTVKAFLGEKRLESVRTVNLDTGEESDLRVPGVFVFIGMQPNNDLAVQAGLALDGRGFVRTEHDMMTSHAGVFAAGDVRAGSTKQAAAAAGEGASAAIMIREWLQRS